ncbi:hypothetical protein EGW08_015210, partial [Elysia chlorotica]
MDEFTLFVPTNAAFEPVDQQLSAAALRYYIVNSFVYTPTVYEVQRLDTYLGPTHQLEIRFSDDDKVLVNNQELTMPDVLVEGGVIHQISGLLHPVLNWCNSTFMAWDQGPCTECFQNISNYTCPENISNYTCPENTAPYVPARIRRLECSYPSDNGLAYLGCQQICAVLPEDPTCCSGYFGKHCEGN